MRKAVPFIIVLVLSLTVGIALAAPPSQEAGGQIYVVQKDDWLSKIAEKYYGDMLAYPRIVEATNARAAQDSSFATIKNPDLIEIGQKLWIPDAAPASSAATGLTPDALRNATYAGIYDQPIPLTDGKYEGEPFVEGGASRPTVVFADLFATFGDLNGDGIEDAAVILAENSGGSGVFIYLAAVVDRDGAPVNAATHLLGDRVEIKSMTIDNRQIVVNMLTQGPDDPFCCPTLEVTVPFGLEGDQLVERIDYAGTYKALLPAASSPGRDITLTLNADGTVQLSTDYLNDEAPIVEIGTWEANADGTATVTLTGRPDGLVYDNPVIITFTLEDGELTAVVYDVNLYGSEGLRLTKQ